LLSIVFDVILMWCGYCL